MRDWCVVIRSLSSSVEQNGAAIAEPLEMVLFPDGVPENLSVAMVIDALGRAPLRLYSNLAAADGDLTKELSDDQPYRDQRDEGVAKLRVDWQRTGARSSPAGAGERSFRSGSPARCRPIPIRSRRRRSPPPI